ncbi:MAG: radical SAM protein [Candidatus Woesearchaeota archaeon]
MDIIEKANNVYLDNFKPEIWFGRCIFLSWYCDVGTCKFCFRSTQKSRIKYAEHARRSLSSVLTEALICKNLGWRIEFLTGGYRIFPIDDLVNITKLVSEVYGEKIWLNLGVLEEEDIEKFRPYIKGIVASIETVNEELHNEVCPNKPIEPYVKMLQNTKNLKKSITIVIGLGEKREDISLLHDFIAKNKLDRITFYALRPIAETIYTKGPSTEDYLYWIANTRIRFPKLEIIAGTSPTRVNEVDLVLKAGANAITKFPATKMFNSSEAKIIEGKIKEANRVFTSTLTKIPDVDWDKQIDELKLDNNLKEQIRVKLYQYLEVMEKSRN